MCCSSSNELCRYLLLDVCWRCSQAMNQVMTIDLPIFRSFYFEAGFALILNGSWSLAVAREHRLYPPNKSQVTKPGSGEQALAMTRHMSSFLWVLFLTNYGRDARRNLCQFMLLTTRHPEAGQRSRSIHFQLLPQTLVHEMRGRCRQDYSLSQHARLGPQVLHADEQGEKDDGRWSLLWAFL